LPRQSLRDPPFAQAAIATRVEKLRGGSTGQKESGDYFDSIIRRKPQYGNALAPRGLRGEKLKLHIAAITIQKRAPCMPQGRILPTANNHWAKIAMSQQHDFRLSLPSQHGESVSAPEAMSWLVRTPIVRRMR